MEQVCNVLGAFNSYSPKWAVGTVSTLGPPEVGHSKVQCRSRQPLSISELSIAVMGVSEQRLLQPWALVCDSVQCCSEPILRSGSGLLLQLV